MPEHIPTIQSVIFDLGGVLIDWNPYYLYRKIFQTELEIRDFLETVCTLDWNEEQDAGRPIREGTEMLIRRYPGWEPQIRAYYTRWEEMLGTAHSGTVEILNRLKQTGKFRLFALTNWSAETFPVALERFSFLGWFDGIVVSGTEKTRKPFRRIFDILTERYQIQPGLSLFIDDSLRNIEGARKAGFHCIHFVDSDRLMTQLNEFGINL